MLVLGLAVLLAFSGTALADAPLNVTIEDLLGTKYKYGGNTEKGFDCSGFTQYVFNAFGIDLPRASKGQADIGVKVAKKDLRKGDLVFFNTNGKGISHVGIYLGNGQFAHSSTRKGVTIEKMSNKYYVNRYVTARRILTDDQYEKIATEAEQQADIESAQTAEDAPDAPDTPDAPEAADLPELE